MRNIDKPNSFTEPFRSMSNTAGKRNQTDKILEIERLSESAAAYYDAKVKEARRLRYS